jgi:hypothetical protein
MQDKLEKPWKFYLSQNKFLKIWENYIRMLHKGNQEYGHVVALQTYVLHFGSAYGLAVACGGSDP